MNLNKNINDSMKDIDRKKLKKSINKLVKDSKKVKITFK